MRSAVPKVMVKVGLVVPTVIGYDPPIQLIHRDDCIDAMVLATKRGQGGAYNIAPAGNEPLSSLLQAAGKLHAPLLPPFGLGAAAFAIRQAGKNWFLQAR